MRLPLRHLERRPLKVREGFYKSYNESNQYIAYIIDLYEMSTIVKLCN